MIQKFWLMHLGLPVHLVNHWIIFLLANLSCVIIMQQNLISTYLILVAVYVLLMLYGIRSPLNFFVIAPPIMSYSSMLQYCIAVVYWNLVLQ